MNAREALQVTTDALVAILAWADNLNYSVDALDAARYAVHDARNVLAVPDTQPWGVGITPVHKRIFTDAARRAKAQHERPGAKRDRCAVDVICGAAMAFNAAGDAIGARSMENAALLVSVRGAAMLEELSK